MNNVFVYGTLKRGFVNHDEERFKDCFKGECKTLDAYPLVVANQYHSPVLINEKGSGFQVMGELYQVDGRLLNYLDIIEGVGTAWGYARYSIDVVSDENQIQRAFVYMKNRDALTRIHQGPMAVYQSDENYIAASDRK